MPPKSFIREYSSWFNAKNRCQNTNCPKFARYGGRGISMCPEWRDDFYAFLRDMGPRPEGHSLNRIDNNGNYEPRNCTWATENEQQANRSDNKHVTYSGQTKTVSQWEKHLGVSKDFLAYRLRHGWSVERAFTTPSEQH